MNLADLAALGTFISGIAVLVSLALLYFQLRQIKAQVEHADNNQRALLVQGANRRSIESNIWLSQPHMSALLFKAIEHPADMTGPDLIQFSAVIRNILLNFQDTHIQFAAGLADDITMQHSLGSIRFFFSIPAVRAWYAMVRQSFAPALVTRVDGIIAEIPLRASPYSPEAFRAQLAALGAAKPAG
jgi:hypothetical protein